MLNMSLVSQNAQEHAMSRENSKIFWGGTQGTPNPSASKATRYLAFPYLFS